MNWWEESEARARRARTPAGMALALWQRFQSVGLSSDLSYVPAYDLAQLYSLAADLIKLVESALLVQDGDQAALRRHALVWARWARSAANWVQLSGPGFNQLLDSLELEPDWLTRSAALEPSADSSAPEEQSKLDGRYRDWHLLFERLDLKFSSIPMEERVHQGLARDLARIYEHCLVALRSIEGLEKESNPRFRQVVQLLLEINTTWHFDLGLYHLGYGELRAQGSTAPGLQTWLLLGFGQRN